MWLVVQFYISDMSSPVQFQLQSGYQVLPPRRRWDLCLWQLQHFGRKDRSCRVVGRVQRRCRAQEYLLGLWHHFEKAVGSGRSTLGSENRKKLKKHKLPSMFPTKRDSQLVLVLMILVVPSPYLSREQDGYLRLPLFLNMNFDLTQDSRQSSYLFVSDMWCQWCGVLAFLTLTTFGLCVPTQSKDEQDWTGIVLLPMVISALLEMSCGPLCSSIYQPPANPACLSGAWDCKQHGQKHHQKHQQQQQQQQQHHSTALASEAETPLPAAWREAPSKATATAATTNTSNNSNNSNNNSNKSSSNRNKSSSNSRKPTANSSQPTQHRRGPRGNRARDLWIWSGFGGRGACACGLCLCLWWGEGGGLGEVKARRHYQLQLELSKQQQSTDKQFTVKPHFTRHAGKAGGFFQNV